VFVAKWYRSLDTVLRIGRVSARVPRFAGDMQRVRCPSGGERRQAQTDRTGIQRDRIDRSCHLGPEFVTQLQPPPAISEHWHVSPAAHPPATRRHRLRCPSGTVTASQLANENPSPAPPRPTPSQTCCGGQSASLRQLVAEFATQVASHGESERR